MIQQHTNGSVEGPQPDLSFVFAIHHALTEDAARIAAAVVELSPRDRDKRIPTLQRYFGHYRAELVDHHTHEDVVIFPALAAKVGIEAMQLERLEEQHYALGASLDVLGAAFVALADGESDFESAQSRAVMGARGLVATLGEHLALEEGAAFPLYLEAISVDEHAELEARIQAMGSMDKLTFMVPWLFDRLPAEVRSMAFGTVPEVFGTVYRDNVEAYRELESSIRTTVAAQ